MHPKRFHPGQFLVAFVLTIISHRVAATDGLGYGFAFARDAAFLGLCFSRRHDTGMRSIAAGVAAAGIFAAAALLAGEANSSEANPDEANSPVNSFPNEF